jgi:hypothetical protein
MSARLVALLLVAGSVACGASVSKTYESDVRFERCYARRKKDVDAGIRQRCWEEGVTFFAVGQPKDRIEYAKSQARPSASGEPLAAATAGAALTGQPLPEPTSVFAPVPMMAPTASASAAASSSAAPAPRSACETRCDKAIEACLSGCGSAICEQFCAQKHDKCAQRCEGFDQRAPAK